jgi:hypothetical protein
MDQKRYNLIKFPRTSHFSWSPGLSKNDRQLPNNEILINKEVIVSLKLDGENTGLTREKCHARSLNSGDHPSRHWVKSLWSKIRYDIPENWHIFGENVFAKHSIFYNQLTSFFYVFAIINEKEVCLSWQKTEEYAKMLELETVPILYQGIWDIEEVKKCYSGKLFFGGEQEGYVVRNAEKFEFKKWSENAGKYVRKNHVQTDDFWMRNWIPNKLSTISISTTKDIP